MFRNEDGVFGHILAQSHPHGYSGQLPFVLKHEPEEKRADPSERARCRQRADVAVQVQPIQTLHFQGDVSLAPSPITLQTS